MPLRHSEIQSVISLFHIFRMFLADCHFYHLSREYDLKNQLTVELFRMVRFIDWYYQIQSPLLATMLLADNDLSQPQDVYSMQGVLMLRNATCSEISSLPAGIYIIGGKKIVVN